MERSITLCVDRETCGETYAQLAYQSALRSGMWRTRPDPELVDGWIDQALELAAPESRGRAKALVARCFWGEEDRRHIAEEASRIAEKFGDAELRVDGYSARSVAAFAAGDFPDALQWTERLLELADQISDGDRLADIHEVAITMHCAMGKMDEARGLARKHTEIVEPLTPHHRLHGVSIEVEVEELIGGWQTILDLSDRTEAAVEANLDTPCIRNSRVLLVTAHAAAVQGDLERARAYERRAGELELKGHNLALAAPWLRLAILRNELENLDSVAPSLSLLRARTFFALSTVAAQLDALAATGDRARLEHEAPALAMPGTYLEPFALRALGRVRRDDELVTRAARLFEEMGLTWYANQTRALAETG
jgi:tetratricopeptide (TPR) repeat protein